MDQRAVRSWILYDWANSAFATTMMAAVLPIFYKEVAAVNLENHVSTAYWAYTNSIAMLLVAILSPVLGAVSDMTGYKMRILKWLVYPGILATGAFMFVGEGDYFLASLLFIIGVVGYSGGNSFYDSLLPDLVPEAKRDMVSSKGFAFGYVGGGILLAVDLLMIRKPELFGFADTLTATRATFVSVAIWWFVFSIPLFRTVKNRPVQMGLTYGGVVSSGFARTWGTLKTFKHYPELLKYIIAFWLFNDGISTVITMATAYGKEIGIGTSDLILALLITQFVGIPFTLLFGKIAEKMGSKTALYISLTIYVAVIILGYFMHSALDFYFLAVMVGFAQGGSQSIARSIYSRLIPAERSAEFFGFLSVSGKFSSIIGPAVFGWVGLMLGSSRFGILSLLLFFIGGILVLTTVNLEKGAREANLS